MNRNMKNASIYFIASILTQLINFILVAIYTKHLNMDQVGIYNLAISMQALLTIFISLGIETSIVRFYYEYEDKDLLKSTVIIFNLFMTIISIIIVYFLGDDLSLLIFNEKSCTIYIYYMVIISSLVSILGIITSTWRMESNALKSSIALILEMILRVSIASYLIIKVDLGVSSLFIAQIFSNLIVIIIILFTNIKNIKLKFSKIILNEFLNYSYGMIFGNISTWVLTLIDRYLLNIISGISYVGLYSTAYKIGMLINPVFIEPFKQLYTPIKFKVFNEKDGKKIIKNYYEIYNAIGWFCILGLGISSNILIRIIATPEYFRVITLIPIIAFSYFLWGNNQFYSLGLLINKKTFLNSIIANIAAVINIILNILLIPKYSVYGATIATCLSYVIVNFLYNYYGNKNYNTNIKVLGAYKQGIIAIPIYFLYKVVVNIHYNLLIDLLMILISISLYCYFIVKFKLIPLEFLNKIEFFINNKLILGNIYNCKIEKQSIGPQYKLEFANIDKLYELQKEFNNELDFDKLKILAKRIEDDKDNLFFVKEDEVICGYCSIGYKKVWVSGMKKYIYMNENEAYLYDDYIFKKYRGRGIQLESIKLRINYLYKNNYKKVLVVIRNSTKNSIYNYKKIGFYQIKKFVTLNI